MPDNRLSVWLESLDNLFVVGYRQQLSFIGLCRLHEAEFFALDALDPPRAVMRPLLIGRLDVRRLP
jgi:hypothetical protein